MQARKIRQRVVKSVGIAAVVAGLMIPSAAAGAVPWESGLTACDSPSCTIVSALDLAASRARLANPLARCSTPNKIGFTCAAGE